MKFFDIQATIKVRSNLKHVRDMIKTYSQMRRSDKYSQHISIIWPVWLNGWVFVYELSGCGFESSCSHLNTRSRTCFEQGVPWHSGNCRVWIHSETRTWHGKDIQSVMTICLIAGQIKKMSLYKMNYYPELDRHNRNKIKVEWYISNNATKSELKMDHLLLHQNLLI